MTKPNNPYNVRQFSLPWDEGYAAGLRNGKELEQRALKALIKRGFDLDVDYISHDALMEWLTARQKSRKKERI